MNSSGSLVDAGYYNRSRSAKLPLPYHAFQQIAESIAKLDAAEFAYRTGAKAMVGREDVVMYKGDKDSTKLIKEKHKDDKVSGPDKKTGIITVELKNGGKVTYLPESKEGVTELQTELTSSTGLKGKIRSTTTGNTMSVEKNNLPALKEFYKNGTWQELGDNLYMGQIVRDGKTVRMYFVTEESLDIAGSAIKAEGETPGSGLEIVKSNLRSQLALDGYNDYLEKDWAGFND